MALVELLCSGPYRMSDALKQAPEGLCSECQTVIPIKRGKFVRHLVRLNGRGSPIAGSGTVAPKVAKRPHDDTAPKTKATKVKKRRKKRW